MPQDEHIECYTCLVQLAIALAPESESKYDADDSRSP